MNDLGSLQGLNLSGNELVGTVPTDICDRSLVSELHIYADSDNCPHDFDPTTGLYQAGCYDNFLVYVDIFLNEFTAAVLGDANCNNLASSEAAVCTFMSNKANHAIFDNRYPDNFPGVWDWLKECTILTRMYYNDGDDGWSARTNWL